MQPDPQEPPNLIIVRASSEQRPSWPLVPQTAVPLLEAVQSIDWAMHTMSALERYSMERLAEELERQAQVITQKGGDTDVKKMQVVVLLTACAAELRAISTQLHRQLLEIVQR